MIEGYQAGGPGWQVRMGEVLAAGLATQKGSRERTVACTASLSMSLKGCNAHKALSTAHHSAKGRSHKLKIA